MLHVTIMRTSSFDNDFTLEMKVTKFLLIHCFDWEPLCSRNRVTFDWIDYNFLIYYKVIQTGQNFKWSPYCITNVCAQSIFMYFVSPCPMESQFTLQVNFQWPTQKTWNNIFHQLFFLMNLSLMTRRVYWVKAGLGLNFGNSLHMMHKRFNPQEVRLNWTLENSENLKTQENSEILCVFWCLLQFEVKKIILVKSILRVVRIIASSQNTMFDKPWFYFNFKSSCYNHPLFYPNKSAKIQH